MQVTIDSVRQHYEACAWAAFLAGEVFSRPAE